MLGGRPPHHPRSYQGPESKRGTAELAAPWRERDRGLGADIRSLGTVVCVPVNSPSLCPGPPWDTGWLVELGQGLCGDPWVYQTGWHPHTAQHRYHKH